MIRLERHKISDEKSSNWLIHKPQDFINEVSCEFFGGGKEGAIQTLVLETCEKFVNPFFRNVMFGQEFSLSFHLIILIWRKNLRLVKYSCYCLNTSHMSIAVTITNTSIEFLNISLGNEKISQILWHLH